MPLRGVTSWMTRSPCWPLISNSPRTGLLNRPSGVSGAAGVSAAAAVSTSMSGVTEGVKSARACRMASDILSKASPLLATIRSLYVSSRPLSLSSENTACNSRCFNPVRLGRSSASIGATNSLTLSPKFVLIVPDKKGFSSMKWISCVTISASTPLKLISAKAGLLMLYE